MRPNTAPPHHHHLVRTTPPPSPTAISNGAPETEPQQLGFGHSAPKPPSVLARPDTAPPHHHCLLHTTIPPPPTFLCHQFQWCTRNRGPAAPFGVFSPPLYASYYTI